VGDLAASVDPETVSLDAVLANDVQCPDVEVAAAMTTLTEAVRKDGDTIGGVIGCVARGVPAGWGDPVFDKLEALLGHALLSLPACKGFEIGSGFGGTTMRGTAHNDPFYVDASDAKVRTRTNFSGGVQGGISNGMPIVVRAAFKPVATLFHPQETVDEAGQSVTLTAKGRHDPCVLPRAVVIVEAMVALVLVDAMLVDRGQVGTRA
jgi:chorismate synthase